VQYVGPAPAQANALPAQQAPIVSVQVQPVQVQPPVQTQIVVPVESLPPSPPPYVARDPLPPLASIPTATAPVSQAQGGYLLQAGSFADLGNAHALKDRLASHGSVSVVAAQVNGSEFYRVMVGPWSTREEAEQAQARMNQAGTKAIVVAKLD
jgi:rare lipoprotein A